MAINFPDNIKINVGNPIDSRYLSSGNTPYTSVSAVNAAIVLAQRYVGLTVNINNVEYWYKDGIDDIDLIEKIFTGGGTITGATNGLMIDGVNDKDIALGGDLITGTTISGVGLYDLNITNVDGFLVSTSGDTAQIILEPNGITLGFSGQSVSFDSNGGLTYDGDYSSGFTAQSLVDANYVTGYTANNFLKLDQSSGQTVAGGMPTFEEGVIFGTTPSASQVTGHTRGKIYYDNCYETLSVQIGDESTLQLGQESLTYVWNDSGSVIPNGAVVRAVGTHCGGGTTADVTSVCLAKADTMMCAIAIGVATEEIGVGEYGFITTRGYVNDLDTTTDGYSGITTSELVYLSPTVAGGVTNVAPSTPNIQVQIGRLTTTGITGKLSVQIDVVYRLTDLADVAAPSPTLDDVLKWNGTCWVNGAVGTTSAGSGVNFYYATPIINSRSTPAGISQDGTAGNGIQTASLSKTPVTTGSTLLVAGADASDTRAFAAWLLSGMTLQRTTIDAGSWRFYDYVYVDSSVGDTYLIHQVYQVVPLTSTVTTSGASANSRTATITSSQFTGTYFNAASINTEASYLQTPSGIYQISATGSTNQVTIVVPTGYGNESAVEGYLWNLLFSGATDTIEDLTTTLYETTTAAPAFTVATGDTLGQILYVRNLTSSRTVSFSYNGSSEASYFITPLVTLHNDLAGLQGGTGNERYHITADQNQLLADITASAAEINVLDGIPPTLNSTELGYVDGVTSSIQDQLDGKLSTSIFSGYTGTTQPIIDAALTGVTNVGGGTSICSAISSHNLELNTFVGSGGTTVQKIGDEIIIHSLSGGTGDDIIYNGQSPAAIDVGGIDSGYILTGKTITCILQDLFVPELFQTSVGTPCTSLAATFTGNLEIGCSISQTLTPTYVAGAITPLYCTDNGTTRGGAANNYSYSGPSVSTGFNGCTSCVINPYVVVAGTQTWCVCTRYDEGACIKGSKGTVNPTYPTVCPQDSCTTLITASCKTITGILPYFYGYSASQPTANQALINSTTGSTGSKVVATSTGTISITYGTQTAKWLWFATPCASTTKLGWYEGPTNKGNIGTPSDLFDAPTCITINSPESCWSGECFKVYISTISTDTSPNPYCMTNTAQQ